MVVAWLCPYPLDDLPSETVSWRRPFTGHPASWLVHLLTELRRRDDISLHVVTLSQFVARSQTVKTHGVTYHILRDAIPFTSRSWDALSQWNARTKFRRRRKKLAQVLGRLRPHLVHGHGTEDAYGLAAVEAPFPSAVSIQGVTTRYQAVCPSLRRRLCAPIEQACVRRGRHFLCRTTFDKSFVRQFNPTASIHHAPEAIAPCFFLDGPRSPPPPRVLFVGGFDPRKNLSDCLTAFARIRRDCPTAEMDVVGDGPPMEARRISHRARAMGLDTSIRFHGRLSAQSIARLQQEARVFIITSLCENSPNALAEALCAGTPPVAVDTGGISSMFATGKSGFLVPLGATDDIAEGAIRLLRDDDLWCAFSTRARQDAGAHQPSRVAQNTIDIYTRILHATQHPGA